MATRLGRTALMGAATVCLLGLVNGPAYGATATAEGRSNCAPAEDVRTVRPLQRVAVDEHVALALIPSADQKHVFGLADAASFWPAVRDQFTYGGPDLADDGVSFGGLSLVHGPDQEEPDSYFGGVWRTECAPSLIAADIDGERHEARLVRLRGADGWGGYYFDGPVRGVSEVTITAYDQDGEVIAEFDGGPESEAPLDPEPTA